MESDADFLDFQKSYKQAAGDKLLFPLLWLTDELNYYKLANKCDAQNLVIDYREIRLPTQLNMNWGDGAGDNREIRLPTQLNSKTRTTL